jgi:hypothetical protein
VGLPTKKISPDFPVNGLEISSAYRTLFGCGPSCWVSLNTDYGGLAFVELHEREVGLFDVVFFHAGITGGGRRSGA